MDPFQKSYKVVCILLIKVYLFSRLSMVSKLSDKPHGFVDPVLSNLYTAVNGANKYL